MLRVVMQKLSSARLACEPRDPMQKAWTAVCTQSRRFASDRSGSVIYMGAIAVLLSTLAIGGAVDVGRWLNARTDLRNAVDSAVLAAARELQTNGGDTQAAIEIAKKYLIENTKDITPLNPKTGQTTNIAELIQFNVGQSGTEISATGAVDIESFVFSDDDDNIIAKAFPRSRSLATMPIFRGSGADEIATKLRVGANAKRHLEVSVMLDVTGSMGGQAESGETKLSEMKTAAKSLVDILVWDDQDEYTSRVALVPFSESVNINNLSEKIVRNKDRNMPSKVITEADGDVRTVYNRTGCVIERVGQHRYNDVKPRGSGGVRFRAQYDRTDDCAPSVPVVPLTSDKDALKTVIDSFSATGYTAGHIGTAWAWYMLSPNFADEYPAESEPASYESIGEEDGGVKKYAVLMTDGEYNTEYCAGGTSTSGLLSKDAARGSWKGGNCVSPNGSSTEQARNLCDAMKEKGIEVFTVGFMLSENGDAKDTMRLCASSEDHAYDASNGEELKQAFNDIALQIAELYLSK